MLRSALRVAQRSFAAAIVLTGCAVAFAGPGPEQGTPTTGQKGITETVAQIMARAKLDPVYDSGQPPLETALEHESDRSRVKLHPQSPLVSQWPPKSNSALSILGKGGGGPNLPQTIGVNFHATDITDNPGFIPPDTMGDVGPTHIVVMVNGKIRSFLKNGTLGTINATTDTFFNSVRNGSGTSDPRVKYDPLTGRWILAIINVAGSNNRCLIAVSSGSNPDTSTWTFYFFNLQDGGGGTADNGGFFDYPTLGVDNNALYIGGNIFVGSFSGTTGFVVRKSSVLSGGPIVVTAFRQMATGTVDGPYTPQGVDNFDSAATQGYFIGVGSTTYGTLYLRRISTPGGTPTISANIQMIVPATIAPQNINYKSSGPLDTDDDRLFAAKICKNTATGVSTLWTAQHFEVNASGVADAAGNRDGSRWYQIQNLSGTPSLVQSGTLFDSAATNPRSYIYPTVAMSGQGHMAMGNTYGGANDFAGVAVSGRLSSDALGSIQAPTLAFVSGFGYNLSGGGRYRWGDYSHTVVDPTDDMTIWTIQEYASATNVWGIRVVQLLAPPPAAPTSTSPSSMVQGTSGNVVVTGTSSSGSAFYYAGAPYNPITATVSGTGVTVNSVTYTDATHVTLNLTVSGAATVGARNITITNPDGQSATGTGIFSVTAASNPVPSTSSLVPSSATAGGAGFTLTVNGSNFISSSVVRWNGSDRTTTFVNANQVTASISAADIALAGTAAVTVFNPAPGGGTSNAQTFTINNPLPTTTSIAPTNATAASGGFTLTVNGTNFVAGSIVRWNGSNRTTTFVNAGQLTASINAADVASVGSATVTVFNPAPGGGTSNGQTFTINPIELAPSAYTLVFGIPRGGNLASLGVADDDRLRMRMNFETTRNAPKVIMDSTFTTSAPTVSRIDVSMEASTTGSPITQTISLWDGTNWIQVDTVTGTLADSVRSVSLTSGVSPYLIGGQIKVRVQYFTFDRENLSQAEGRVDRLHLTVYP